jgi:hypothetical protein
MRRHPSVALPTALTRTVAAADDLGTIDARFNAAGTGSDDPVEDMAYTGDLHVVITDNFLACNGEPVARIARLGATVHRSAPVVDPYDHRPCAGNVVTTPRCGG